jgi:hypothetical protein
VYIRDYRRAPLPSERLMLHAATLGFAHPVGGRALAFRSEPPADFGATLESLRHPRSGSRRRD